MLSIVRTTVTLDADTEQVIRRRMRDQKVSFKQALNDAIRDGGAATPSVDFRTHVFSMGRPTLNLDRAMQIAAELEDDDLVARMRSGS